ncbi:MAG TPA: hypothetical protein VK152_06775, partial [Paludibacter sp.]|nr:hypothetical protein [Paludibacter sp.]
MKKDDKPWSEQEENSLSELIKTLTVKDIAKMLGRSERSVNIKMHRLRLPIKKGGKLKELVSRNIVHEMLTQRIGSPESFRPTREFLDRIGMGQKRFWQL